MGIELIDIHHHIIPCVDDGASSREMALKMLEKAKAQGIAAIVCTSHTCPGRRPIDMEAYREGFEWLKSQAEGITLIPGNEILYTSKTANALHQGAALCLGDTSNALVEFRPDTPLFTLETAIGELVTEGYTPIIAHAERYACLRGRDCLSNLRDEMGAYIQVNAESVIECGKLFGSLWLKKALKNGLVDAIASDAHDLNDRPVLMQEAYSLIYNKYGSETARLLCRDNPARFCSFALN